MLKNILPPADIIAINANDEPVLLVEVKTNLLDRDAAKRQLESYMAQTDFVIHYAMLVDKRTVEIFRWQNGKLSDPIFTMPTARVLSFYDPEFAKKEIFSYYMVSLVESWLRDIAYHWKYETPPGFDKLKDIWPDSSPS